MGITASHASLLVLIARLWDAFFDPMMGAIADRTETRWGRFRPWLLWSIIPWAVLMVLAYTVPGVSVVLGDLFLRLGHEYRVDDGLFDQQHAVFGVMAVMTRDQKQRTNLSQYRLGHAAMIGQLIVGGFTLVIMNSLGGALAAGARRVGSDAARRR